MEDNKSKSSSDSETKDNTLEIFNSLRNSSVSFNLAKYENFRKLSQSNATIYLANDKEDKDKIYAIKVIDKGKQGNISNREKDILQKFKNEFHENLVKFFDFEDLPSRFELFLVLEFCEGGSLEARINSQDWKEKLLNLKLESYHFKKLLEWSIQITKGVSYLHSKNIIHRDLKPANVLFKNEIAKICDFGLSRLVDEKESFTKNVGTSDYMGPELNSSQRNIPYNELTDIWSLGCILYEIFTLQKASDNLYVKELKLNLDEKYQDFDKLIYSMLKDNYKLRPAASQVLNVLEEFLNIYLIYNESSFKKDLAHLEETEILEDESV